MVCKKLEDLHTKFISDLVIPKQLEPLCNLISCLTTYELDDESSIKKIFKLIDDHSINPVTVVYILQALSSAFPKKSSSLSNIIEMMYERSTIPSIKSPFKIVDLDRQYKVGTVLHAIVWDNLTDLINETEKKNFNLNKVYKAMSLIEYACAFGSENCFTYLKLKGATISKHTPIFAVKGGNKNIITSLFDDSCFEITDYTLKCALMYHQNDIFDWLLQTKGSIESLNIEECSFYGNVKGMLYLIDNGFDINEVFGYHYNKKFENLICLSI